MIVYVLEERQLIDEVPVPSQAPQYLPAKIRGLGVLIERLLMEERQYVP